MRRIIFVCAFLFAACMPASSAATVGERCPIMVHQGEIPTKPDGESLRHGLQHEWDDGQWSCFARVE